MVLPNFLIVGVQKSGTTSIYNYLSQHPQIYTSSLKETNFLERDWENLPESHRKYSNACYSFSEYQQLFEGVKDEIAIGEASPNYLFYYQQSIPQIKKIVPQAKLIVVLRNPVERAYSDYLMHVRDAISNRSLEEQIEKSPNTSHTLLKGKYGHQLAQWFEAFPREQIQIFLYDDLKRDSVGFMQNIYRCLEVSTDFNADTSQRSQTAQVPKNNIVNSLLKNQNPVRTGVSSLLRQVVPAETRKGLRDQLIQLNSRSSKEAYPLLPETKQALIQYYRSDIEQLQGLLDRDLSAWMAES